MLRASPVGVNKLMGIDWAKHATPVDDSVACELRHSRHQQNRSRRPVRIFTMETRASVTAKAANIANGVSSDDPGAHKKRPADLSSVGLI